jgi:hypothetical protein
MNVDEPQMTCLILAQERYQHNLDIAILRHLIEKKKKNTLISYVEVAFWICLKLTILGF